MSRPAITVTGAGRGIGLSIIKCLLKDTGPDTVIFAVDVLSENLEELQKSQPRLEIVLGDVSQRSTSEKLLERIHARDCRLETLILNAGVLKPIGPIVEVDVDQFKRLFDINFFALIYTIQLTYADLQRCKGKIIFTSSGVAKRSSRSWVPYACSKTAMNCLSYNLATELPEVPTVCISPGVADTAMQAEVRNEHEGKMDSNQWESLVRLHDGGKLIHPDRVAMTYVKLAREGIPPEVVGTMVPWDDERISAGAGKMLRCSTQEKSPTTA